MKFKMKQKLTIITMGLFSLFGCGQKNSLAKTETELLNKLTFKTELLTELKSLTKNELKQLPEIDQETGEVLSDKFYNGIFSETTEEKAVEFVKKLKTKYRENGYLIFVLKVKTTKKMLL
jgi:hypothetical protein